MKDRNDRAESLQDSCVYCSETATEQIANIFIENNLMFREEDVRKYLLINTVTSVISSLLSDANYDEFMRDKNLRKLSILVGCQRALQLKQKNLAETPPITLTAALNVVTLKVGKKAFKKPDEEKAKPLIEEFRTLVFSHLPTSSYETWSNDKRYKEKKRRDKNLKEFLHQNTAVGSHVEP